MEQEKNKKKVTKKPAAKKQTTKKAVKTTNTKPQEVQKINVKQLRFRQIMLVLLLLLLVLGISFGFTYAWMKMNEKENLTEEQKLASLEISLDKTNSSSIVLDDLYPMNEIGGLSTDPYKLTLKNNGKYSINYALNLEDDLDAIQQCSEENEGVACKTISRDELHYSLKKDGGEISNGLLKDSHGVIDMGIIEADATEINYELKLWLDYDTEIDFTDAKFYGKFEIRTMVGDE